MNRRTMTAMLLVVYFYFVMLTNVPRVLSYYVPPMYSCLWCLSLVSVPSFSLSLLFKSGCLVTDCPSGEPARRFCYDDAG